MAAEGFVVRCAEPDRSATLKDDLHEGDLSGIRCRHYGHICAIPVGIDLPGVAQQDRSRSVGDNVRYGCARTPPNAEVDRVRVGLTARLRKCTFSGEDRDAGTAVAETDATLMRLGPPQRLLGVSAHMASIENTIVRRRGV